MDPITQGVVGAAVAQSVSKPRYLGASAWFGALGGMAADLDVFIRSTNDPLLALEYHRHFTHSLLFIPLGGLMCALVFYFLLAKRRGLPFSSVFVWATLGYATHGLLDGCTSYGTQLLWPLTNARFSIDVVSVVDPLFTLPAMALVIIGALCKRKRWVFGALVWGLSYLTVGAVQHHRAIELGQALAAERGHTPVRLEAKPSFANLVVWKVIYEAEGQYYVAAVKPGLKKPFVWDGSSVAKLDVQRDFPWLDPASQQAKDVERFAWFSDGFLAVDASDPNVIVDMRYSLLPHQIQGLWGIELSEGKRNNEHVQYISSHKGADRSFGILWSMIWQ